MLSKFSPRKLRFGWFAWSLNTIHLLLLLRTLSRSLPATHPPRSNFSVFLWISEEKTVFHRLQALPLLLVSFSFHNQHFFPFSHPPRETLLPVLQLYCSLSSSVPSQHESNSRRTKQRNGWGRLQESIQLGYRYLVVPFMNPFDDKFDATRRPPQGNEDYFRK